MSRNLQQVVTGLGNKASSADCVALLQSPACFTSCETFSVLFVGSCVALIFFFPRTFGLCPLNSEIKRVDLNADGSDWRMLHVSLFAETETQLKVQLIPVCKVSSHLSPSTARRLTSSFRL